MGRVNGRVGFELSHLGSRLFCPRLLLVYRVLSKGPRHLNNEAGDWSEV